MHLSNCDQDLYFHFLDFVLRGSPALSSQDDSCYVVHVKLHNYVQNGVKLYTLCKTTQGLLSHLIWYKLPSLKQFYNSNAVDFYEVCVHDRIPAFLEYEKYIFSSI